MAVCWGTVIIHSNEDIHSSTWFIGYDPIDSPCFIMGATAEAGAIVEADAKTRASSTIAHILPVQDC